MSEDKVIDFLRECFGRIENRLAAMHTDIREIRDRMDRTNDRLERIERRLDLVEAH
jgi:archaellum component FlaC